MGVSQEYTLDRMVHVFILVRGFSGVSSWGLSILEHVLDLT